MVEVVVNGEVFRREVSPAMTLVDLLRDEGLTGTKDACSLGECGACTVLIGSRPVLACLTLVGRVRDPVVTVEGLAPDNKVLRESFADNGALQCGYCTPGQIVTAAKLLGGNVTDVPLAALDGNLCRCTGYKPILAAISDTLEGEFDCR